jgi:molybdopterin-guanine dinucleotide biosynthesis protein A
MGGPKALMEVGGRAWWQVQRERIERAGREALWVVSHEVGRAMPSSLAMVDGDPGAPMFASVVAGVTALRDSAPAPPRWVHVLPVDVPAPERETFDVLEQAAGEQAVSVPACAGRSGHPVCLSWGWIEDALLPAAARGLADRLRLDDLAAPDRTVVRVCDENVTVNLNTPQDVEAWLKSHG